VKPRERAFKQFKNPVLNVLSVFRSSNQRSGNVGNFVVECSVLWTDCRQLVQPGFEVGPSSYSAELLNNFVYNNFVENHEISKGPLLKPGMHISRAPCRQDNWNCTSRVAPSIFIVSAAVIFLKYKNMEQVVQSRTAGLQYGTFYMSLFQRVEFGSGF